MLVRARLAATDAARGQAVVTAAGDVHEHLERHDVLLQAGVVGRVWRVGVAVAVVLAVLTLVQEC